MTLFRLAHILDRLIWRWRKPPAPALIIRLSCRRVKLQAAHKSTKAGERELRAAQTEQLRKELAR